MQSNKIFLEPAEVDAIDNLSHYERMQLRLHGNILRETKRDPIFEELGNEEPESDNDFQNHIYSYVNPAS